MNAFLYVRGLSETDQCICGRASETPKHLMFDCGLYDGIRELNDWAIVRLGAWDTWELRDLVTQQGSYEEDDNMECTVDLSNAGPSHMTATPRSSSVDAGTKRKRTLEDDGQGDERLVELRNVSDRMR
ncbi:hypothetical protein CBL_12104 [Carabus blaptoides fortunei]